MGGRGFALAACAALPPALSLQAQARQLKARNEQANKDTYSRYHRKVEGAEAELTELDAAATAHGLNMLAGEYSAIPRLSEAAFALASRKDRNPSNASPVVLSTNWIWGGSAGTLSACTCR